LTRTFQWDERKAETNRFKHGIRFEEAQTAFSDPLARVRPDPDHSEGELREVLAGTSTSGKLLLVSFTQEGETIRIISARELTRSERKYHEEERVL
jgi:uncharacterized DUF497 family protein